MKNGDKKGCIYKKWNGKKQGAKGKKYCSNCSYCAGIVDNSDIYCTGENMLDVTGKNWDLTIEEKLNLLYLEDESDICNCRCPKCGNDLEVIRNLGCFSIKCSQTEEQCDFTARISILNKKIYYIGRNSENKELAISKKIKNKMPSNDEMVMYEEKHLGNFEKGYCPYCNSKLKINPKEPRTIICSKFDYCFFKAIIRENNKVYFNKRFDYDGLVEMDIPYQLMYKG